MDLLSAQDWSDIRSALTDVKDTFLEHPVTYRRRVTRTLNSFHESRKDDLSFTDYPLTMLLVPEKEEDNAEVQQENKGYSDHSIGDMYFDYNVLLNHNPSLISSGQPVFIPNKDTFIILGKEVTIIAVTLIGPTEQNFQLVKVRYKKDISI